MARSSRSVTIKPGLDGAAQRIREYRDAVCGFSAPLANAVRRRGFPRSAIAAGCDGRMSAEGETCSRAEVPVRRTMTTRVLIAGGGVAALLEPFLTRSEASQPSLMS